LDWYLISSLATLALVIFTIIWGTGLWARIEKVEIKTSGVNYKTKRQELITFEVSDLEVQRTGQKEIRYLTKILLKLDEEDYGQLKGHVDFHSERELILLDQRIGLPKHKIQRIPWPQYEWRILDSSEWDKAKEGIQDKLSQAIFEVGLVWEDKPNKIKWQTIMKEDYGKWVKL